MAYGDIYDALIPAALREAGGAARCFVIGIKKCAIHKDRYKEAF